MEFIKTKLNEEFSICQIISLHYFEFARDFVFKGEKHDFWEFLYVDKGEAEIMADTSGFRLKQGDIIFHKPNEFHSVWANRKIAPNLIVISFECNSSSMGFFENKIFNLSDNERNLLAVIVKEGYNAFMPPFDIPDVNVLKRKASAPFGCEQLIRLNLEMLLISLVRKGTTTIGEARLSSSAKERSEDEITSRIIRYMHDNISLNLTLEQLCTFTNLGATHLRTLFKAKTGKSVIEYFKTLKIEQAKILIREEKYNFTEIAEKLGYSSIHSFSRHFRLVVDMSPSEYARTVKARVL